MRKIIAGMFITLDGVVEAPEKWNPPYYDDELNQAVMPLLALAARLPAVRIGVHGNRYDDMHMSLVGQLPRSSSASGR